MIKICMAFTGLKPFHSKSGKKSAPWMLSSGTTKKAFNLRSSAKI